MPAAPQALISGSAAHRPVPYAAALPAAPAAVPFPGLIQQQQAVAAAAVVAAQQTAAATQAQYAYNASGNFAQHVTDEEVLIAKIPPQVRKQVSSY